MIEWWINSMALFWNAAFLILSTLLAIGLVLGGVIGLYKTIKGDWK